MIAPRGRAVAASRPGGEGDSLQMIGKGVKPTFSVSRPSQQAGAEDEGIQMSPANTPVIFVHGQWLHATSWDLWVDLFREAGYAPQAPGWPGDSDTAEETRRQPERVAGKGIDDVVAHYAEIIRGLDAPPIVIGHSFG